MECFKISNNFQIKPQVCIYIYIYIIFIIFIFYFFLYINKAVFFAILCVPVQFVAVMIKPIYNIGHFQNKLFLVQWVIETLTKNY